MLERVTLAPKRGQVNVQFVALGWDPDVDAVCLDGRGRVAGRLLGGGCGALPRQPPVPRGAPAPTRDGGSRAVTRLAGALALPLKDGSVRFAVIGDSGRGDQAAARGRPAR